jgi:outer membrane lipoprotein SlyB
MALAQVRGTKGKQGGLGGIGRTVGSALGSLIGSAVAPGVGTIIGGAAGGLAGGAAEGAINPGKAPSAGIPVQSAVSERLRSQVGQAPQMQDIDQNFVILKDALQSTQQLEPELAAEVRKPIIEAGVQAFQQKFGPGVFS